MPRSMSLRPLQHLLTLLDLLFTFLKYLLCLLIFLFRLFTLSLRLYVLSRCLFDAIGNVFYEVEIVTPCRVKGGPVVVVIKVEEGGCFVHTREAATASVGSHGDHVVHYDDRR
jgi:hypothetical protein